MRRLTNVASIFWINRVEYCISMWQMDENKRKRRAGFVIILTRKFNFVVKHVIVLSVQMEPEVRFPKGKNGNLM